MGDRPLLSPSPASSKKGPATHLKKNGQTNERKTTVSFFFSCRKPATFPPGAYLFFGLFRQKPHKPISSLPAAIATREKGARQELLFSRYLTTVRDRSRGGIYLRTLLRAVWQALPYTISHTIPYHTVPTHAMQCCRAQRKYTTLPPMFFSHTNTKPTVGSHVLYRTQQAPIPESKNKKWQEAKKKRLTLFLPEIVFAKKRLPV